MVTNIVTVAMAIVLGFLGPFNDQSTEQQTTDAVVAKARQLEDQLANNQSIKDLSAGILQPIYDLAEYMSFPWFYWVAFAAMSAGVVSFALQLVLTKLLLLFRLKLRLSELLSDALGLLVSLCGLVVVTQAATENSTFTTQSISVVSAAAVGLIVGFVFYLWGQKTELLAARDPKVIMQTDDRKYKL
jgi:hypothetical protein